VTKAGPQTARNASGLLIAPCRYRRFSLTRTYPKTWEAVSRPDVGHGMATAYGCPAAPGSRGGPASHGQPCPLMLPQRRLSLSRVLDTRVPEAAGCFARDW
jgi:hypothetical protein